jgi:hypothetical protein
VYHFSSLNDLRRLQQWAQQRAIRFELIIPHVHDHDPKIQQTDVLLMLKFAVDGNEYVEGILSELEQRSVAAAAPSDLRDCLDVHAWKCRPHSGIDTLV